jgi:hypothetical protein
MDLRMVVKKELGVFLNNPGSLHHLRTSVTRLETEALENEDFSTLRVVSLLKDVMINKLLSDETSNITT